MKLVAETNKITSTVKNAQSATIKVCPTAFKILSSQIYNDKISAIIREISCNAADSHVEAGNEEPIIVHLPTRMEPTFKVQDMGTGIPHDKIMEIYMTYFGSTKQDANDVIGGLGIGGKSPLSYTDQFMVENVYDGIKSTYVVFFNEEHVPDVSRLSESKTDAPNGVTVSVPVKEGDVHEFSRKAQNIFKWFEKKPKITGAEIDVSTPDPVHASELFQLYNRYDLPKNSVIMGGVVYALEDMDALKTDIMQKMVMDNGNILIPFEIGELEVSASREGLSMTFDTQEKLNKRISQIEKEFINAIQEKIDACDHVYEIFDDGGLSFTEKRAVSDNPNLFTFGGVAINDKKFIVNTGDINITPDEKIGLQVTLMTRHYRKANPELRVFPDAYTTSRYFAHKNKIYILHADQTKHIAYNRKTFLEECRGSSDQFITPIVFCVGTEEGAEWLKTIFDGFSVDVEKLSDRVARGVKTQPKSSGEYQSGHYHAVYKFTKTSVDEEVSQRRVPLNDIYDLISDGVYFVSEDFRSPTAHEELNRLVGFIDKGTTVIAVNETNFGKVKEKGGVVFSEYKLSDENKKKIEQIAQAKKTMDSQFDLAQFAGELKNALQYINDGTKLSDLGLGRELDFSKTTVPSHKSIKEYYEKVFETVTPFDLSHLREFKEAIRFFYPSDSLWRVVRDMKQSKDIKEVTIMLTSLVDAHKMIVERFNQKEEDENVVLDMAVSY